MKIGIGMKLFIGLGVILVLVCAMSGIFYVSMKNVEKAETRAINLSDMNTFFSERVVDHLKWVDGLSTGLFIQGKDFQGKLDPEECSLGKWMKTFKLYSHEIEMPFRSFDGQHKALHESTEKIIADVKSGQKEKAYSVFTAETIPAVYAVQENLSKMKEILKRDEETKDGELKAALKKANTLNFGLTVFILSFGVVGGTIFVRGISNGIVGPLEKMKVVMGEVAEGNLAADIAGVRGSGEIVEIA